VWLRRKRDGNMEKKKRRGSRVSKLVDNKRMRMRIRENRHTDTQRHVHLCLTDTERSLPKGGQCATNTTAKATTRTNVLLLEFTGEMTLHEGGLSDTAVTDKNQLEFRSVSLQRRERAKQRGAPRIQPR
jgi:hypothetical protein